MTSTSSLLTLPVEIRKMIYHQVFEQEFLPHPPRPAFMSDDLFVKQWRQRRGALVRCCRQIQEEALPVLRQVTIHAILKMTMVEKPTKPTIDNLAGIFIGTKETCNNALDLIKQLPNLQSLELSTPPFREWRWTLDSRKMKWDDGGPVVDTFATEASEGDSEIDSLEDDWSDGESELEFFEDDSSESEYESINDSDFGSFLLDVDSGPKEGWEKEFLCDPDDRNFGPDTGEEAHELPVDTEDQEIEQPLETNKAIKDACLDALMAVKAMLKDITGKKWMLRHV